MLLQVTTGKKRFQFLISQLYCSSCTVTVILFSCRLSVYPKVFCLCYRWRLYPGMWCTCSSWGVNWSSKEGSFHRHQATNWASLTARADCGRYPVLSSKNSWHNAITYNAITNTISITWIYGHLRPALQVQQWGPWEERVWTATCMHELQHLSAAWDSECTGTPLLEHDRDE